MSYTIPIVCLYNLAKTFYIMTEIVHVQQKLVYVVVQYSRHSYGDQLFLSSHRFVPLFQWNSLLTGNFQENGKKMTRSIKCKFFCIHDSLSLNNSKICEYDDRIYPSELEIKDRSICKFYCRHQGFVNRYGISVADDHGHVPFIVVVMTFSFSSFITYYRIIKE